MNKNESAEIKNLTYEVRQKEMELTILEERRKRGNPI